MWNPFRRKEERATLEEILLSSGVLTSSISKDQALNIPAVSACVELIATTVASLPVRLYREENETSKVEKDSRSDLLNEDTQDLLDGFQLKRAMVEEFLLFGGGYTYIRRNLNKVESLHFVENRSIGINKNTDPIDKKAEVMINGAPYREFEFIKLLRKSKDGVTGKGIIKENNLMLSVAYNQMIYEEILVKTGGNKKGFLKATGRLGKEALDELKLGWKQLYANNNENILILNNGLEFQEASQTSVEMQLSEHKRSNVDEICKLFLVSPRILTGEASDEEYNNWIKSCIMPILAAFEAALNKDLLLPSEKENHYFAFDTTELTKGDIKKRYEAYEIGVKSGILQIDEVRYKENLSPLGLEFLKLGLQDVLYFSDTGEIYTPNTNKLTKMGATDNENVPNNSGLGETGQQPNISGEKTGSGLNNNSGNNTEQ